MLAKLWKLVYELRGWIYIAAFLTLTAGILWKYLLPL